MMRRRFARCRGAAPPPRDLGYNNLHVVTDHFVGACVTTTSYPMWKLCSCPNLPSFSVATTYSNNYTQIYEGTNQIQRVVVAKHLLK